MSCQVNVVANIIDVGAIRRCLFPLEDSRGSDGWLHQCEVSISPAGDIIVFAKGRRLVVLSRKWNSTNAPNQFQITYSGSVHEFDNITSVLCLPIVSQTKSSHVVPDFTCILLGFESGFVRFYTEDAELLLEEQLHNEIIGRVKCRSQHNPRTDLAPELHPEKIYIQYQSCICVLSGRDLIPVLRSNRSELAKVQAKGAHLETSTSSKLSGKKWGFQDQASVHDVAVVGVNLHCTFDHLLTVSNCGGFESKYRSSAPYNNLVLAAGSRPFLGYHYAMEGGPLPVFGEVAKAVATKIKSALPGWLTGGSTSKTTDKQTTFASQPCDTMGCRFGLCDLRRTGHNVVLSANHKLAALSDSLGRVLLINAFRGICLRMFKGYRDAQCAFVQVPDEKQTKFRVGDKLATFLIIYSPKKGTLEIFTTQQGQKIATFTASKHSRLIYNNYGIVGYTSTSKSRYVCLFDVVLLDNDGSLKEITIPFHFALSEKNNTRAKDIHFYKKIKQMLRDQEVQELSDLFAELKTNEIKLQALSTLLQDKHLTGDTMLDCLMKFEDSETDSQSFKAILANAVQVLYLFQFLSNKEEGEQLENSIQDDTIEKLFREQELLHNLQKLVDLSQLQPMETGKRVAFSDNSAFVSPSQFLSTFDLNNPETIALKSVENVSHEIGALFFKNTNYSQFAVEIAKTRITSKDLFFLAVHNWINSTESEATMQADMQNAYNLFKILIVTLDKEALICEYNSKSILCSEIRAILSASSRPFQALKAAHLFRILSEELENLVLEEENMELLSQERVEWALLIGKLEDVALLSIILSQTPQNAIHILPRLKHENSAISLDYVLKTGRGSVSELVSRWITTAGTCPEDIVVNENITNPNCEEESNDENDLPVQEIPEEKVEELAKSELFKNLNLLRKHFPYSLESGNILANMCWEYALAWQKDLENLGLLQASIKCLVAIPGSHVREGLCLLAWNTHLKLIYESSAKLLNKVGKLPKERLCRQDTGLTDYQLVIFFETMTTFFDRYQDSVQLSHGVAKPQLRFEPIWDDDHVEQAQNLSELALQQNSINYDLLHLHYLLNLTLEMMTAFALKQTKPLQNLFENYMHGLFFTDLQTKAQINWNYTDIRVQENRTKFLCKVIVASMENIKCDGENRIYAADHMKCMSRILDLATLWNLDLDALRRFELLRIYTCGYDVLGGELLSSVVDKQGMAVEMLAIAGKRLRHFLSTSPDLVRNITSLSTAVTRYIEDLDSEWCAPSSLESIENLANTTLYTLSETSALYKTAEFLLDGCQMLRRIHRDS